MRWIDGEPWVRVSDLMGFYELRETLGLGQSQASMRLRREREEKSKGRAPLNPIPEPIARISNGYVPIWDMAQIEIFKGGGDCGSKPDQPVRKA